MPLTLDTSEYIPTQREDVRQEIDKVLDDFMEPLVDSTIIAEIRALGYAANMPQSFIDGVKFRKTTANKGVVINTWGTEEKPLAKWFNYGTITHWIEPKEAGGVLAWSATPGGHAWSGHVHRTHRSGSVCRCGYHAEPGNVHQLSGNDQHACGYRIGLERTAGQHGRR